MYIRRLVTITWTDWYNAKNNCTLCLTCRFIWPSSSLPLSHLDTSPHKSFSTAADERDWRQTAAAVWLFSLCTMETQWGEGDKWRNWNKLPFWYKNSLDGFWTVSLISNFAIKCFLCISITVLYLAALFHILPFPQSFMRKVNLHMGTKEKHITQAKQKRGGHNAIHCHLESIWTTKRSSLIKQNYLCKQTTCRVAKACYYLSLSLRASRTHLLAAYCDIFGIRV